jgi:hypothetical protein
MGAALAAAWPILRLKGMPYDVDISGFFPLSPEAYQGRFWPLWNERGGMSAAQFLPALAFEAPLLLLGSVFGWSMEIHLKVRIVLGFAIAGCAMYALAKHYLARRAPQAPAVAVTIACFAAALLYMLNPWSVHRIFHYFLWIGYAMAPLVVLAFERLADAPSWRRALALAGVTALATTDPHNPFLLAILVAPLALVRFAPLLWRDRPAALRLLRGLGLAAGAYLAFAAYWILPYAYNALHNPGFGPTYVMSQEMLDTLSRHGSFLEALRFLNNYLPRGDLWPQGGAAFEAWAVASFLVPILAGLALLVDRSRVAWTYALLAAAMVFLGMGTHGPFPGAYRWLIFGAPWGEGLSWLFRDPYRWGGIQALAYSVLLSLSLGALGAALTRLKVPAAAPAIGLAAVLVFSGPALASYTTGPFAPIQVPHEYAQANAALAAAPADASVVWMPRMLGTTTWSGDRTMEYFDATSSARPALGPFRPDTSAYFDFLGDAIKDGAQVAPLLARAGADRIVYHNDVDTVGGARAIAQIDAEGLNQTARFGDSPTLVLDASGSAPAFTPAARFALYGERNLTQAFTPRATRFAQLSLRLAVVGAPGPLRVSIADANGTSVFVANASVAPKARSLDVPLRGLALDPGAVYALRLDAGGDATDRYDVSYYTVDTYADGALSGTQGDLAFDLFADTRGFAVELVTPTAAPRARLAATPLASPSDLQLLRAVETLPAEGALRDAPIAFVDADRAARDAFARQDAPWGWIGAFDEGNVSPLVPFLPPSAFVTAFDSTSNADTKDGWARGTQDFSYYGLGWQNVVGAAGDESWGSDGGDGLVYATTPANLTIHVKPLDAPGVLLARVYVSPDGGPLTFHAGENSLALDTAAPRARLVWVEVGRVAAGATSLQLQDLHGLQGVDALALVDDATFAAAGRASAERMANAPTTLVAQAETIPALANQTVALVGVGRVSTLAGEADVPIDVPAPGDYTLWLRMPAQGAMPLVQMDGAPLGAPACSSACGQPAAWFALDVGRLEPGAHALRLAGPAQLDVLALSSDPAFAARADAPVGWTRVSATEYQVHATEGGLLALALPYDAGWVAHVDGASIRAIPVDGVANGFVIPPGAHDITIVYEPQTWAQAGLLVSLAAAFACLALAGAAFVLRRRADAALQEVSP